MRNLERAPRMYELMTVLHPDVPEESLPAELDRITGYITAAGGDVIETLRDSPWGRRRLAYPIRSGGRDVRDGYYAVWHMNLGPTRITDLERELKLNTQVIRYIVVSWAPKVLTEKEIEAAEIAAEDAAAAEFAAAEDAAAAEYAASVAAAAAAAAPVAETGAAETEVAAVADAAEPEVAPAEPEAAAAEAEVVAEAVADREAEAVAIEAVAEIAEREELMADAAAALEQEEAAVAAEASDAAVAEPAADEVPAGAVRGDGTATCPDDYPVKGNASSMLYHSPGSPAYSRTNAEFCFASTEAAEAAGFKPTRYEAAQDEAAADAE